MLCVSKSFFADCAGALCVRAHAVVRAQGRALCAGSGLPGLRAGGALTWADVLVLVCVLRFPPHGADNTPFLQRQDAQLIGVRRVSAAHSRFEGPSMSVRVKTEQEYSLA